MAGGSANRDGKRPGFLSPLMVTVPQLPAGPGLFPELAASCCLSDWILLKPGRNLPVFNQLVLTLRCSKSSYSLIHLWELFDIWRLGSEPLKLKSSKWGLSPNSTRDLERSSVGMSTNSSSQGPGPYCQHPMTAHNCNCNANSRGADIYADKTHRYIKIN